MRTEVAKARATAENPTTEHCDRGKERFLGCQMPSTSKTRPREQRWNGKWDRGTWDEEMDTTQQKGEKSSTVSRTGQSSAAVRRIDRVRDYSIDRVAIAHGFCRREDIIPTIRTGDH